MSERGEGMIHSCGDLKVFQKAYKASLEIHAMSLRFPKIETFALGDQIRRATKSIPLNIAEGFGKRASVAEFRRYLSVAIGSCDEVKVELMYSKDLGYIDEAVYEKFTREYTEIVKMLMKLYKDWRDYSQPTS